MRRVRRGYNKSSQTAMKRFIALLSLLLAFETVHSVFSTSSYVAVLTNAMFRANLERTGVYKTQGMPRLHGVKWKFKTERIIEAWFSSPTVSDDMLYFGSDDSYMYALNALTGELKWKLKTAMSSILLPRWLTA